MKKIIGICNLHDDPSLGLLTKHRPLGAVTFLGRYALIDFTLSNFTNSHIDRVYVLVKHGVLAMRNHIGSGSIWLNNTKTGSLKLLLNEEGLFKPKFNTDVANLKANLDLDSLDFEYAVIAPSFMLSSLDYRPYIEKHEESGADATIIYSHIENVGDEYVNCDRLKLSPDGRVSKIDTNLGKSKEADISLESFIVNKKFLKKIINDSPKISQMFSLRQLISYYVNEGDAFVRGEKYDGYFVPILDLDHYVSHSLDLLNYHIRCKLFIEDWPIYTTTHNTPPALYGKNADVKNSFIANGAIIKGKVANSIISRDVVIEKGANVSNCIIFTDTVVGKDVKMKYVLCDKGVQVNNCKELAGKEDNFLYIEHGVKI